VVLSADAADAVDAAIAEQTEQLTPRELERIRDDLGVDQTEMSEILGLGGKTYHRWEKGNQVPSRSMGFYLRVLAEFPEAAVWLRKRGWRKRNRLAAEPIAFDFCAAFPDLTATQSAPVTREVPRYNPARALFGKAA
jgi:DNA-binding transcriptional regulator YiaG